MPPDVFLALAGSGLTLIASMMFLVTPPRRVVDEPLGPWVTFCLPPLPARPPPLPQRSCSVDLSTASTRCVMTLRAEGEDWLVTVHTAPRADAPALQLSGQQAFGAVSDLRWHGRGGLSRATSHRWRLKPARA